ncbi:MAG: glycosyltransferase family 4 protein [Pseudomonadota bacterium]|nr:glycosyltransferase family 4 protein [Pseudomonadota bacterium]
MRILFFSHYYPPEVNAPASRTSEHCRAWAQAGAQVTVVTCAPNHPNGKVYPGYRNRLWQSETRDGVRIVRLWTWLAANEGFLPRVLNYVSYMVAAILALPFLPRTDVIVTTSPQFFCGLVGLFARPVKRAPWVLEIRDIWPESIVAVGAMKKGAAIRFLEWLEGFAYRQADAIISLTRGFIPHIAARCGDASKIAVFMNGADLSAFSKSGDGDEVKRKLGLEGKFVGAYVGTHGMAHGLDTILDAAELLKGEPRFAFLMAGGGAEEARLRAARDARKLDNVVMLGQRPKAEMPGLWSATDASLILLKRSDTFKTVYPSKMSEAMAMQCPVILGVEGEAKEVLEAAGAGLAITPESATELAAAMRRLADDPELAASYGRAGRAYADQNLDRAKVAARFLALLAKVAAREPIRETAAAR